MMLAAPWSVHAAGLGRLNVLSGLGQPFRGEIDLVSVQPEEADSLVVSLAPPDAYGAAQVPYPSSSLGLHFNIDKRPNGQYYVTVSSSQSISEPVLELLIDLNWASGRIQREYTALIDPVGYGSNNNNVNAAGSTAPRALPGAITPARPVAAGSGRKARKGGHAAAPAPQASAEKSAPAPAATAGAQAGADSYTVKTGDTLSSIAHQVQPDGVSLEQVLVSLYRNNADAFNGNMNRLKRGKILQIPSADQMNQVSRADAAKEIHLQSQDWHSYRQKVAENTAATPAENTTQNQGTSGKIGAKVEDKGAASGQPNKDVLKLSNGAKAGGNGTGGSSEEDKIAHEKAIKEAQGRVDSLQKNVKDMKGLLALQGKTASQAATPTPAPTPAPTSAPAVAASAAAAAPVASEASAAASEPAAAVASPVAASKPRHHVVPVAPAPTAEPSFFDSLMDNPLIPGAGLLVLLLGAGAFVYNRRRKKPAAFDDSIITGGDLKPNTVLGQTGGAVISTQPTENSFLTDFSRQGLGTIDTDEVDPIAEAEVYMAYGRDAQAEEILKDALMRDPSRNEIRLKLLEIHAARKDKTSFEEIASELYATQNGRGPVWEQAAYIGHNLDPENPLYLRTEAAARAAETHTPSASGGLVAGVAAAGVAAAGLAAAEAVHHHEQAKDDLDFDLGLDAPAHVAEPVAAPAPVVEAAPMIDPLADLDLGLGAPAPAVEASPAHEEDLASSLDFDLDEFDAATPAASGHAGPVESALADFGVAHNELDDLSFGEETPAEHTGAALSAMSEADLDLDLPALEAEAPVATPVAAPADDLGLDFSFDLNDGAAEPVVAGAAATHELDTSFGELSGGTDTGADFGADDPVQTKIDLARAYIDMGDIEGAREILNEADAEGNAQQKQEIRGLLNGL
ncbi:FimV/HubP family polar landmark protein [Silvimonas terrae]|nr:FimV/HubP family polar landmark protein [Silvimonas terrae]